MGRPQWAVLLDTNAHYVFFAFVRCFDEAGEGCPLLHELGAASRCGTAPRAGVLWPIVRQAVTRCPQRQQQEERGAARHRRRAVAAGMRYIRRAIRLLPPPPLQTAPVTGCRREWWGVGRGLQGGHGENGKDEGEKTERVDCERAFLFPGRDERAWSDGWRKWKKLSAHA